MSKLSIIFNGPHQNTPRPNSSHHFSFIVASLILLFSPGLAMAGDHYSKAEDLLKNGDLRGSQIEFRNAVKDDPENGAAHLGLANVDIIIGDLSGAQKQAEKALALGADPPKAAKILMRAYIDQQHPQELLETFHATGNPPDIAPIILTGRARAELMLDHVDLAEKEIAAAKLLDPNSADILIAESQVYAAKGDEKMADKVIEDTLKSDPHNPAALRRKAQLISINGDFKDAIDMMNGVLERDKNDIVAHLERADFYIASHQNDKAKEDVDFVQKSLPNNAQAVYLHAILMVGDENYKAASTDMVKLSSALTRMPNAYYIDALINDKLGNNEQAYDSAQRYFARFPKDLHGVALLVKIDMERRAFDDAAISLNKAILVNDKNPALREMLGQVYYSDGKINMAIESYQDAISLTPDNAGLYGRLGELKLDSGDNEGAAAAFEKSLKIDPKQPKSNEMLVLTHIVSGDFPQAQKDLEYLRKEDPDSAMVGNMEGLLKLAQLDYPGAQTAFEKVIKNHPEALNAKISLARLWLIEGRMDDARKILNEILKDQPDNHQAIALVVLSLEQQDKKNDAISFLAHAHEVSPNDVNIATSYANSLLHDKKPNEALAVTVPSSVVNPVPLWMVYGAAQVSLGMKNAAIETYRKIIEASPSQTEARLNLAHLLYDGKSFSEAQLVIDNGVKLYPKNYDLMQASVAISFITDGEKGALVRARELSQDASHLPVALPLVGDLYMAEKQYDAAIKAYSSASVDHPSTVLMLRQATAYSASGQQDKMKKTIVEWIQTHDDDITALLAISDIEIANKNYESAIIHLNSVLAKNGDNVVALNNIAWLYQKTGRPGALNFAERAYLLSPSAETADTLGYILTTEKNQSGLALLVQAHRELPNDPAIQYHLAMALVLAGHRDDAATLLEPITGDKIDYLEKGEAQKLLADLNSPK